MWSNLNDSFSAAITGTITNIRQSIPTVIPFHEDDDDDQADSKLRKLQTKLSLLSSEVARHRAIGLEYKNRWLKAETLAKDASGHSSEVYDEIDLLSEQPPSPALPVHGDLTVAEPGLSTVDVASDGDQQLPPAAVASVEDLALDSATVRIHRLEDELKKMDADRQHWQALAKQKSNFEDQLEQANSKLSACADELAQSKERCAQLATTKDELAAELQELDSQHEMALMKVVGMRDQLLAQNQALETQVQVLKRELAVKDQNEKVVIEEHPEKLHSQPELVDLGCQTNLEADVGGGDGGDKPDDTADECAQSLGMVNVQNEESGRSTEAEAELKARIDHLEGCLAEIQLELDRLAKLAGLEHCESNKNVLSMIDWLHSQLQSQIQQKQVTIDKLEAKVTALEPQLQQLEQDKTTVAEEKKQLYNTVKGLEKRLKDQYSENQQALDQVNLQNDQILVEMTNLKSENQTLQLRLQETAERLQTAQQQLPATIDAGNEPMAVRQEPEGATVEDNNQQQSLTDQDSQNESREQAILGLQSKLEDLLLEHQHLLERFEAKGQELDTAKAGLEEANRQLELLSNQTELCDQLRAELDQSRKDCHLMAEKSKLNEEELRSKLDNSRLELEQTQCRLEEMILSGGQLEKSLAEQTNRRVQCEAEVERLGGELERLRRHLVMVEDNYTQELVSAEDRCQQMTDQLAALQLNTVAGQQTEEEIRNLTTQRDKARNEASMLEDKLQQYGTSISNLQAVIEQLDKEHERKLKVLEADHLARLDSEQNHTAEVMRKLQLQEQRLHETLEALEAASRLSETIDQKEFTIGQLKRECHNKQLEMAALQQKMAELEASYEGKVDKQIVKNLLISYFASAPDKRTEGERLLALFLDFNQLEMERAGIRVGGRSAAKHSGGGDSFTSRFVQFLELESKPSQDAVVPAEANATRMIQQQPSSAAELARDLNKRLSSSATTSGPINPFVGGTTGSFHSSSASTIRGSGTSSSHSSMENLRPGIDLVHLHQPELISEVVREALDHSQQPSQKYI